jgi:hypothetical protein
MGSRAAVVLVNVGHESFELAEVYVELAVEGFVEPGGDVNAEREVGLGARRGCNRGECR